MTQVLAVVGPTASGKSALAVALAQRLSGEVVSADAYAIYRGMDIGTATPSAAERAGVPHHLIDIVDPVQAVTVAEFQQWARTAIEDVAARGRLPILVGGSGLYVAAVLDDLQFPGTDPLVRARLEQDLQREGSVVLHARLGRLDPAAALAILPTNGRRIVRALEVIEITGEPFTATLPRDTEVVPATRVGLRVDREVMDARIAARVQRMWAEGLLEEVRALPDLAAAPTASRALGYSQALAYLAGTCTREEAIANTVDATRRFARRQQRWFGRDERVTWVDHDAPDLVDQVEAVWRTAT